MTGAGSGIGLATAQAFAGARRGSGVYSHQRACHRSAAEQLLSAGRKAIELRCDVDDEMSSLLCSPDHLQTRWTGFDIQQCRDSHYVGHVLGSRTRYQLTSGAAGEEPLLKKSRIAIALTTPSNS